MTPGALAKKRILVEGWRTLPHSYAIVNSFHCLEMLRRDDVELFHRDVGYVDSKWQPVRGLFSAEQEAAIASIPGMPPGDKPDAIFRIAFPYNLAPAAIENVWTFGTAELGCVPDHFIAGNKKVTAALAENPHVRIITPSNWSRAGFVQSGADPNRVFVIPLGIDPELYHPIAAEEREALRKQSNWDGFVFLSVGAMTLNKGLLPLFQSFAAVANRHPEVQLVMKGLDALYPSKESLLRQATGLTGAERTLVESRLHYKGETLSFADIAKMYQIADAYVSPYLAEGFNMPVLEAAASGLPVICTAGGATDDFTHPDFALSIPSTPKAVTVNDEQGKVLVPDTAELIKHMFAVIEQPEIRARAREAGPAFVRNSYTWRHVVDKLLGVMFA